MVIKERQGRGQGSRWHGCEWRDGDQGKTGKRDREEDSIDMKEWMVIKERHGKLLTEQEAVLKVWESYFKELLNEGGNNNKL